VPISGKSRSNGFFIITNLNYFEIITEIPINPTTTFDGEIPVVLKPILASKTDSSSARKTVSGCG